MKSSNTSDIPLDRDERLDVFLDGQLRLIQSRDGYRFSIDAVFLARFAGIRAGDLVVDLGTGCGIIPLFLLAAGAPCRVIGIEIQENLASQAFRNVRLNGFQSEAFVVRGDIRHPPLVRDVADVVICNPPYRKVSSGRINPDPRRAIARHEILVSLEDILQAAKYLLKKKGRLAMVYPATRLADVFTRLRAFGLEPKRLQIQYPDLLSGAALVLIEALSGGKSGLHILPPLLGQGDFSISSPTLPSDP